MDFMHPGFHSRKQLAWGTVLFATGFLGSTLAGIIGFIGWNYCKCSEANRPAFIVILSFVLFSLSVNVLFWKKINSIDPVKVKKWFKPLEKRPFLPFLTIGLWGFLIVMLTTPVESWFRYAFGLLIYMPISFGFTVKMIPKIPDKKPERRDPVEDTAEYRSIKATLGSLPNWLFAKDMLGKSLNVRLSQGATSTAIEEDHPIPTTIRRQYHIDSSSPEATLEVFWFEKYKRTPEADYLITNIPKGSNGKSTIEVIFKINANKELTCEVAKPLKIEKKSIGIEAHQ